MKQKKAKICFVIYIAGFFFKKKFCYEVIAKQKKKGALLITTHVTDTHTSPSFSLEALSSIGSARAPASMRLHRGGPGCVGTGVHAQAENAAPGCEA